jgi:predicted PolB exonuclease-like 3'-5' exonuclease
VYEYRPCNRSNKSIKIKTNKMNKDFDFERHPWESFLFLDIETVARVPELKENTPLYDSFAYKMRYTEEAKRKGFTERDMVELYASKAALYPEFGKVVAITVGKIVDEKIVLYTFSGMDEQPLLYKFMTALQKWTTIDPQLAICGVNIKFFDLRFMYIRSVINNIVPVKGHISFTGFKPWEIKVADITDVWKQTSPYNAPLVCMAECLGLPSPKSDIDGSEVSGVFWNEGQAGLTRIVEYCERDVATTVNIARRLRFAPILEIAAPDEVIPESEELPPLLQRGFNAGQISQEDEADIIHRVKKSSAIERQRLVSIVTAIQGRAGVDKNFINQIETSK